MRSDKYLKSRKVVRGLTVLRSKPGIGAETQREREREGRKETKKEGKTKAVNQEGSYLATGGKAAARLRLLV